jgi:hypothetical protein
MRIGILGSGEVGRALGSGFAGSASWNHAFKLLRK